MLCVCAGGSSIALDVLQGLHYLHSNNVVHLDIKVCLAPSPSVCVHKQACTCKGGAAATHITVCKALYLQGSSAQLAAWCKLDAAAADVCKVHQLEHVPCHEPHAALVPLNRRGLLRPPLSLKQWLCCAVWKHPLEP